MLPERANRRRYFGASRVLASSLVGSDSLWIRAGAVLVPLAALLGLAYCVTQRTATTPVPVAGHVLASRQFAQGDFFASNVPERPRDLNPFTTVASSVQRMVLRYTHDTLLDLDPRDAAVRPALAEVVERSSDGLAYTLALRAGVTFSDGKPVTVADVAFTHAVVRNPGVPVGGMHDVLSVVASFESLDERRFTIRLARPYFAGIDEVGQAWRVTQRAWFEAEVAKRARALGEPVPELAQTRFGELLAKIAAPGPGTGPYQVLMAPGSDDPILNDGREVVLVRNESSWRRFVDPKSWNLAGMRIGFVLDETQEFELFKQQRTDWWSRSDAQGLLARTPELAKSYQLRVFDSIKDGNYGIFWNCRKPTIARGDVRRGLTMCFDRRFFVREILAGQAREAVAWFHSASPAYPKSEAALPFDPAEAKRIFDSAAAQGAPRLTELVIGYPMGVEYYRVLLERAVPEFAKAGVRLVLQPTEFRLLTDRLAKGEFDGVTYLVTHPRWVDPYVWFHSSQRDGLGKNFGGYSDPEVDEVLVAARGELDEGRRLALWHRFHLCFVRDQPVTLLAHPRSAFLLHKRFSGVEIGALGLVPEHWWVEPSQQLWNDRGEFLKR